MADEDPFIETRIPHQRIVGEILFPAIVAPNPSIELNLSRFIEFLRAHKGRFEELLHRTGAVLFRGFPVRTAADFDRAVEAFGYEELPYVGGAAPRSNVVGRVFTSNESPPDQAIPFHHEMCRLPTFPSKLFLFCEEPPRSGGETPIVLSHCVYERMKERYPEFVEKLEELGLIYTRITGEGDDPSPIGRGWQSTFSTNDKRVAEERAAQLGMNLEWMHDGVKTITRPIPAVKFDESRGRKIWFNSIAVTYTDTKDDRKGVTFGDGTPLPADIIHDCLKILEEEAVAIPWKQGDILLLDNLAILHSRRSCVPPRRILASLCV